MPQVLNILGKQKIGDNFIEFPYSNESVYSILKTPVIHIASNKIPHLYGTLPHFKSRQPHDRNTCYEAPKYDCNHLNFEEPIASNLIINAHHERNLEKEYRKPHLPHGNR